MGLQINQAGIEMRNPIAKNVWKFNRAAVVMPKKGKGSFKRTKQIKAND